ncbi:M20 metallopeptidase family protein [Thermoflexibacter ruber]|uniref:Hippurate hydrolase n=1 Tax=Thermoflexibacter ruber TaxID=1003 RepID=A0A1I2E6H0_9BACT|nr:amidohydrolase [Thermoflexibacter ruber]SFE88091.1 hippurate hydrolase [Thermoflexibacter ruber]
MKIPSLICIILLSVFSPNFAQKDISSQISVIAEKEYPRLDELYKYLHANPELSNMEKNTSARVAKELREAGFEVTENVGGYGVVGVLKNGEGKTILVRADMDGLPIKEETGLPYASKITTKDDKGTDQPAMHACGHDIHISVLIGTARAMSQLKNQWKGTIVFIGQPAEEKVQGAYAMLKDGLYTRFPRPDYILGLHASASLPAGKVGYCPEYALANVNSVNITVYGEGGHGAYPHTTKDPIVLSAYLITQIQTIVSRQTSPLEPCVVTVGSIHGGSKHNIIPNEVKLQLTLRSYSEKVRQNTIESIKQICKGLAIAAGLPESKFPKVEIENETGFALYNNPELTEKVVKSLKSAIGENNVEKVPPVMAAEDFGELGKVEPPIPVCLYWLGTVAQEKYNESQATGLQLPPLHSSLYAPLPEPSIKTGVKTMTKAVIDLLADGSKKK